MNRYNKKIDKVYANAECIYLDPQHSYVLMSDCHRGDGNWNDNFANNKSIYLAALQHYYKNGYSYIELGDGDELWENKNMDEILEKHVEVFDLLKKFYFEDRFTMMYGNHDFKKSKGLNMKCFPEIPVYESVFLKCKESQKGLFLLHGHQGDFLNDTIWKVSRFLVRYIWRPLELLGVRDPTSAAKNYKKKEKVEKKLSGWAKDRHQVLIAGHTHRPFLAADPKNDFYYNTGSCVHPHSITAIEIVDGSISLVKWVELPDPNRYLHVSKEVLGGPTKLSDIFS